MLALVQRRLIVVATICACSSAPQSLGKQPSWRDSGKTVRDVVPTEVVFAPSAEAAANYNEPFQAPPSSPLGDAALAAIATAASQARVPAPAADARLFRACAELAQIVPEEGVVGYSAVEFALQRNGIIEPSPHLIVVWGEVASPELIVEQLRPRLPELLRDGKVARVGIAAARRNADGSGAVVFALQSSGIATSPIPRKLAARGTFKLNAVVDTSYHSPEVFITRDDGSTERVPLTQGRSGGFKSTVRCNDHIGRQQVEIAASDAAGSTVLANFPVWCGMAPPRSLVIETSADNSGVNDTAAAEKRLLDLMNRDRQAQKLPALVWDDRLARVAKAHSEEMRHTKVVAHVSPVTGSAADRVRNAGIRTGVVLENVARAYGIAEAHAGLMNSPGHRANLMSTTATHVGMGVVLGDDVSGRRELFLTQVFARFPPKIETVAAAEFVRARIAAVRAVFVNVRLSEVAQQVAAGLAAGQSRESVWGAAKRRLDAMVNSYARVGSVITAVSDLSALEPRQLIGDYNPDDIGIGIAQGKHPDIGDGAIWVVILAAERNQPLRR